MIASSMPDIAKCNHGKHISYAIIAAIYGFLLLHISKEL